MKDLRPLAWIACICVSSSGQSQALEWLRQFNSSGPNLGTDGTLLAGGTDGSIYAAGTISAGTIDLGQNQMEVSGDNDALLLKLSPEGAVAWGRLIGGPCSDGSGADDDAYCLLFDAEEELIVVGGAYSGTATFGGIEYVGSCQVFRYGFIAAYDELGVEAWGQVILGEDVLVSEILKASSGELHVFGAASVWDAYFSINPLVSVPVGGFHAIYGADGSFVFAERMLAHGQVFRGCTASSGMLVCGTYSENDTLWGMPLPHAGAYDNGFLCLSDGNGLAHWVVTVGSSTSASFIDGVELSNGDFVAHGRYDDDLFLPTDTLEAVGAANFLACYSADGTFKWAKNMPSPGFLIGFGPMQAASDGSFYFTGTFADELNVGTTTLASNTSRDNFVLHLDSMGNVLHGLHVGRVRFGNCPGLVVNSDGIYVGSNFDSTMVIGAETFLPTVQDYPDLFVAKFDSLPAINSINSLVIGNTELLIYANPNNGTCTVELPGSISPGSEVQLRIIDNMGRLVDAVPLRLDRQGRVEVDIRAQAKGLYHLELLDGARRYTGKIVFE